MEHSRSPRWTIFPCLSARIWNSIWRGSDAYFSINIDGSLNALAASLEARLYMRSTSASFSATRIPRPPPPADAFRITGYPIILAILLAYPAFSNVPLLPLNRGTLLFRARSLATVLFPMLWITSEEGPMKMMFSSSHLLAKMGFSARKPYPGWTASILFSFMEWMIRSMSRNSGVSLRQSEKSMRWSASSRYHAFGSLDVLIA